MKAIFARYGTLVVHDCVSFSDAKEYLNTLEKAGYGYAIGIFAAGTLYLPDTSFVSGEDDIIEKQKLASVKHLGCEVTYIEKYKRND